MKALTLWQPWAWAMACGLKRIENRIWEPPASMLGQRFALHAGRKWHEPSNTALWELLDYDDPHPPREDEAVHGAIVATTRLVAVVSRARTPPRASAARISAGGSSARSAGLWKTRASSTSRYSVAVIRSSGRSRRTSMSANRVSVSLMHGSQAALLKWFKYDHLPEKLQAVSKPCGDLAHEMADAMPNGGAELTAGLRHLLEAKDCFVRSSLNGATSTD